MSEVYFLAKESVPLAAAGITDEHIDVLSDTANDMLTDGISQICFAEESPLQGTLATEFKWGNIGLFGGFRFTAMVSVEGSSGEPRRIDFLIRQITETDDAALESYKRMSRTDVSVN